MSHSSNTTLNADQIQAYVGYQVPHYDFTKPEAQIAALSQLTKLKSDLEKIQVVREHLYCVNVYDPNYSKWQIVSEKIKELSKVIVLTEKVQKRVEKKKNEDCKSKLEAYLTHPELSSAWWKMGCCTLFALALTLACLISGVGNATIEKDLSIGFGSVTALCVGRIVIDCFIHQKKEKAAREAMREMQERSPRINLTRRSERSEDVSSCYYSGALPTSCSIL